MTGRILLVVVLWLGTVMPAAAADPFDPVAVMAEVQAALARGDLDGAAAIYGRALEDPAAADVMKISFLVGRSRVRVWQGRSNLALADADAAVALADRSQSPFARGNIHAVRGLLLAEAGRRGEAAGDLEAALTLLRSPDADYTALLTKMEELRPGRAAAMREQAETQIRIVKEKLDELRRVGGRP